MNRPSRSSSDQPARGRAGSLALCLAPALAACTPADRPRTAEGATAFDPIAFFAGRTRGTGVLKVAFHRREQTVVTGDGHMAADGAILLDQVVVRGHRAPTRRFWRITAVAPGRYAGTLTDATGPVTGMVEGGGLHLSFRTMGGLRVDQWLACEPGCASARNVLVIRKKGVPVARLDEVMRVLGMEPSDHA